MTGFLYILLGLTLASELKGTPITDPYVKNLALVGVIHVEGAQAKGQSVAVLRDKASGRTRMLHKGDRLIESNLEVRELGPQQVTLARGPQTFVLRVEGHSESSPMLSQVESTDVELVEPKSVTVASEPAPGIEEGMESSLKPEGPVEQRRLIPDADCTGDECPELSE